MHFVWAAGAAALVSAFGAVAQNAPPQTISENRRPGTVARIELIGDSTQTDNAGYGRGFCANLTAKADCINLSKGGASTKTFRRDGLWAKGLASKPDYMLIQFGHNDLVSPEHTDRQVPLPEYKENLREFVKEARQAHISPVLVTPLTRRYFQADGKIHSDLVVYSEAMKAIASETRTPLIDLQALSIAYLDGIGEAAGLQLGIMKKDSDGRAVPDKTHLNWQGSYVFGRMVAEAMGKTVPALSPYVRPSAALLPPEGQLAMQVIRMAPFKIVLVGDSTVAEEGGWGPGFCRTLTRNVTCTDVALNGRSTKSFIAEGAWARALEEKGQYYFIQFGHNDQKQVDPARYAAADTDYKTNLHRMVVEVRSGGAIPVLLSPLSRRNFREGHLISDDGLADYAAAAKAVAAEDQVTFVDLYSLSQRLLGGMTQEQADAFDMAGHPDAKAENAIPRAPDRTHLNGKGKTTFGRMVADTVVRLQVELAPNVTVLPEAASTTLPKQAAPTDRK